MKTLQDKLISSNKNWKRQHRLEKQQKMVRKIILRQLQEASYAQKEN